mmetsp:Transcript_1775/g.6286  ORF Transcript_1775/g.6286 Transcript_1775/m.6286 type:complete len:262 (+) Transcript_1775:511-1296(+)
MAAVHSLQPAAIGSRRSRENPRRVLAQLQASAASPASGLVSVCELVTLPLVVTAELQRPQLAQGCVGPTHGVTKRSAMAPPAPPRPPTRHGGVISRTSRSESRTGPQDRLQPLGCVPGPPLRRATGPLVTRRTRRLLRPEKKRCIARLRRPCLAPVRQHSCRLAVAAAESEEALVALVAAAAAATGDVAAKEAGRQLGCPGNGSGPKTCPMRILPTLDLSVDVTRRRCRPSVQSFGRQSSHGEVGPRRSRCGHRRRLRGPR